MYGTLYPKSKSRRLRRQTRRYGKNRRDTINTHMSYIFKILTNLVRLFLHLAHWLQISMGNGAHRRLGLFFCMLSLLTKYSLHINQVHNTQLILKHKTPGSVVTIKWTLSLVILRNNLRNNHSLVLSRLRDIGGKISHFRGTPIISTRSVNTGKHGLDRSYQVQGVMGENTIAKTFGHY